MKRHACYFITNSFDESKAMEKERFERLRKFMSLYLGYA